MFRNIIDSKKNEGRRDGSWLKVGNPYYKGNNAYVKDTTPGFHFGKTIETTYEVSNYSTSTQKKKRRDRHGLTVIEGCYEF